MAIARYWKKLQFQNFSKVTYRVEDEGAQTGIYEIQILQQVGVNLFISLVLNIVLQLCQLTKKAGVPTPMAIATMSMMNATTNTTTVTALYEVKSY
jgi:hypothetical protein